MPYLLSTDGSLTVQKDVKGALVGNKGNVVRRMFVVNDSSAPGTQRCVFKEQKKNTIIKKKIKNNYKKKTHTTRKTLLLSLVSSRLLRCSFSSLSFSLSIYLSIHPQSVYHRRRIDGGQKTGFWSAGVEHKFAR